MNATKYFVRSLQKWTVWTLSKFVIIIYHTFKANNHWFYILRVCVSCRLPKNTVTWTFAAAWIPCEKQICKMNKCNNECENSESTGLQNIWHNNSSINILNRTVVDYTLSDDEYSMIYDTIVQKHADDDSVLDYLLANISKTTSR